jgi:hypothetical protein
MIVPYKPQSEHNAPFILSHAWILISSPDNIGTGAQGVLEIQSRIMFERVIERQNLGGEMRWELKVKSRKWKVARASNCAFRPGMLSLPAGQSLNCCISKKWKVKGKRSHSKF